MSSPLVLIPGLLCSAELFAAQITALWSLGPVTVASTLEGETIEAIAAAILRDAPPSFALAGVSMGGYICMEVMRQEPERVAKLALVSTSGRPDTVQQTDGRRKMLNQAQEGDFGDWAEAALTSIMHPSRQADVGLRAINRRMALAVGLNGYKRQTDAVIGRPDSRQSLTAIRAPTLVLVGEDDALIPPEHSREITSLVTGAKLVIVPECGHSAPIEQPALVSATMQKWLSGQS